ncbi:hypothetical protein Egran_02075 [Elaphomyces granulatus]|uniref:Uncharacterized protein n=1 Tax=Elaphomyces granulatus TaxID=519963 RepID=A0A232M1A0_9EURO|nr:hypothetical protein Egran_02075 [Elaphomyces granulatus]
MATTFAQDVAGTMSLYKQSSKAMQVQEHNLLSGLPQDHEVMVFSGFKKLQRAAKFVLDKLNANGQSGNQFIVVLDLPEDARAKLANDKDVLGGIDFRFQFDETTGVIKVPSAEHDETTENLKDEIRDASLAMGVPKPQMTWGMSTTHKGTHSKKGKQPDQCFWPAPRHPTAVQPRGWPTLVIETGVTESLPKLREDVLWWFLNSNGDVRIVLVLSISTKRRTALLEKWQLAPANTPQPMTRATLPMPPLVQQMPTAQQPYAHQEIQLTQTTMTGGPLVLPFEALFCRPPQGTETDITLTQQELLPIIRLIGL